MFHLYSFYEIHVCLNGWIFWLLSYAVLGDVNCINLIDSSFVSLSRNYKIPCEGRIVLAEKVFFIFTLRETIRNYAVILIRIIFSFVFTLLQQLFSAKNLYKYFKHMHCLLETYTVTEDECQQSMFLLWATDKVNFHACFFFKQKKNPINLFY